MRILLFLLLVLTLNTQAFAASNVPCVSPHLLLKSVVRISSTYPTSQVIDSVQQDTYPAGTGWFLDPRHVATVEHVAEAIAQPGTWTPLELFQVAPWRGGESHREVVPARIVGSIDTNDPEERIAILELQTFFAGAQSALVSPEPLVRGEPIIGIGFPNRTLQIVKGHFIGAFDYELRIEVSDNNGNRDAFGPGASGSPYFDCSGRVKMLSWGYQGGTLATKRKPPDMSCHFGPNILESIEDVCTSTNIGLPAQGLLSFMDELRNPTTSD